MSASGAESEESAATKESREGQTHLTILLAENETSNTKLE